MGNYQVLNSRGDPISADRHMIVYLYPNAYHLDNEAENATNAAITSLGDQLYNNGIIGYYEININYDHPYLEADDRHTFLDNFNTWYQNQGYDDYKGAHVGLENDFVGGKAFLSNSSGGTIFTNSWPAVFGTYGVKEEWQNTAMHEVMHTMIREDLSSVADMIVEEDHDLGIVYSDGSVSPLATGYAEEHAHQGTCSPSNAYAGYYKKSLSECSKDAIEYTAQEEV